MADADRVQVNIDGDWDDILTDEVKGLTASLQDEFGERIAGLREARLDMIDAAVNRGVQPGIVHQAQLPLPNGQCQTCQTNSGTPASRFPVLHT